VIIFEATTNITLCVILHYKYYTNTPISPTMGSEQKQKANKSHKHHVNRKYYFPCRSARSACINDVIQGTFLGRSWLHYIVSREISRMRITMIAVDGDAIRARAIAGSNVCSARVNRLCRMADRFDDHSRLKRIYIGDGRPRCHSISASPICHDVWHTRLHVLTVFRVSESRSIAFQFATCPASMPA